MVHAEQALAQQADAIWASSHALADHHGKHAKKVHLVLNALTHPPPAHAQPHSNGQVLGYLGVIDRWFDWHLVIALAKACPQATIELVGPIHTPAPELLPLNVHCLPPVPQHQVYETMARFDVGLIPFANNDVTAYVDPVKYYEYRALGLPVLSTRFGEMARRGEADGVYFWDQLTSGDVNIASLTENASDKERTQEFCELNSWKRRFDPLAETLCQPVKRENSRD
jgi:hypothetical protein